MYTLHPFIEAVHSYSITVWVETLALVLFMLSLRLCRQQYNEYRAPIEYMNALLPNN